PPAEQATAAVPPAGPLPALAWLAGGLVLAALIAANGWDRMLYVLAGMAAAYGLLLLLARVLPAGSMLPAIAADLRAMPLTMRRLAVVQFFSWFALLALWIYAIAPVAGAPFGHCGATTAPYNAGATWGGVLFAAYNGLAALAAVAIPWLAPRLGLRGTHMLNLCLGALGLLSFLWIRDPQWLLLSMVGVGFAWASILSLP